MLCFTTRGTPVERGRQQGEICRSLFRKYMAQVMETLAGQLGVNGTPGVLDRVGDEVQRWVRQYEAVRPEAVAVCRALAKGLEVPEEQYFAVMFNYRIRGLLGNCTTIGFWDQEGHAIIGKTDDIDRKELGLNVIERAYPDAGYAHLQLQFGGILWPFSGLNECGLAMALTGVPGPTREQDGVPSEAVPYGLLETCATVDEAREYLEAIPTNHYGISVLLADAVDHLALLEKTGAGSALLPPGEDGSFVHTNHLLDPEFAARNPEPQEPLRSNGLHRYENARRQLKALPKTAEGLRRLLSNRSNPGAIWQKGEAGLWTDYAILLRPAQRNCTGWTTPPTAQTEQPTL